MHQLRDFCIKWGFCIKAVPDLPGCVAVAETRNEVCKLIQEAIELYVEALEEEGLSAPEPQSYELVEIPA